MKLDQLLELCKKVQEKHGTLNILIGDALSLVGVSNAK